MHCLAGADPTAGFSKLWAGRAAAGLNSWETLAGEGPGGRSQGVSRRLPWAVFLTPAASLPGLQSSVSRSVQSSGLPSDAGLWGLEPSFLPCPVSPGRWRLLRLLTSELSPCFLFDFSPFLNSLFQTLIHGTFTCGRHSNDFTWVVLFQYQLEPCEVGCTHFAKRKTEPQRDESS